MLSATIFRNYPPLPKHSQVIVFKQSCRRSSPVSPPPVIGYICYDLIGPSLATGQDLLHRNRVLFFVLATYLPVDSFCRA